MIETLMGSRLRAKVLGWLFSHPDERYFVRQLTVLVKEDSTNVSRELARLEKAGILISTKEGKQKYFQANRHNPVFNELHGLILKTVGVADIIRKALETRIPDIRLSFIFGSMANKTENRLSDIDLLVVGNITFGEAVDLLLPAEQTLNRELNPVVYSLDEFNMRLSESHYLVNNVISGDKIFIVGDENELQSLVGKGLVKGT